LLVGAVNKMLAILMFFCKGAYLFYVVKMSKHPKIRKAIFPVGGMGTRFLPATKAMPKEMLPVVDKPIIQYAVEEAWAAGIEECIFVTGRGKSAIEDHFDHSYELQDTLLKRNKTELWEKVNSTLKQPGQIAYIRQQEPMGLGHAVWCARNLIGDEPFAVLLADDLVLSPKSCLQQMIEAYNETGGTLVALTEVEREKTSQYGIVHPVSRSGKLVKADGIVEKPKPADAPSNLAVIGRYILQPEIFTHLSEKQLGAGGEIQLTDALAKVIEHSAFHGLLFDGERFDCGNHLGFLEANIAFALDRPELKTGVETFIQRYVNK
jgi:UTP--glucose-1-phosphate uridylyltransferase